MKKILLLLLTLFAIPVFADGHFPMDGVTHSTSIATPFTMYFDAQVEQHKQFPTMKYFIKPFDCKIWTNYEGDPGFGVKVTVYSMNTDLTGNYPVIKSFILAKDDPLELYATFGIVSSLYNEKPIVYTTNNGCSPFDSHCKIGDPPTIYESCALTN